MSETPAHILIDPAQMPPGDYAIVELLGHRKLVGRIAEVTRFGATMLSIEPLFARWMLGPVLVNGASIYQLTPCPAETAWDRRAKYEYEMAGGVSAIAALIAPEGDEAGLDNPPAFLSSSLTVDGGGS